MKINIVFSNPENDLLEIGFYRGKSLLHNVFYEIAGLSEAELFELEKEAIAKFGAVFPEISAKDVMKGFCVVDEKMYQLYKETFPVGGYRGGGRPKGTTKENTKKMYSFRLSETENNAVKSLLKKMRNTK